MPRSNYLFTSESVSEGHPDKVCDRISDTVVDAYLAAMPEARLGGGAAQPPSSAADSAAGPIIRAPVLIRPSPRPACRPSRSRLVTTYPSLRRPCRPGGI